MIFYQLKTHIQNDDLFTFLTFRIAGVFLVTDNYVAGLIDGD
jgi:hypothetical protein